MKLFDDTLRLCVYIHVHQNIACIYTYSRIHIHLPKHCVKIHLCINIHSINTHIHVYMIVIGDQLQYTKMEYLGNIQLVCIQICRSEHACTYIHIFICTYLLKYTYIQTIVHTYIYIHLFTNTYSHISSL